MIYPRYYCNIEIDTNPPAGAQTEGRLVRKHLLLALRYLTERSQPEPNATLLRNTPAHSKQVLADVPWRDGVRALLEELDLYAAVRDVRPFLEHPGEAELLTRENFLSLLR